MMKRRGKKKNPERVESLLHAPHSKRIRMNQTSSSNQEIWALAIRVLEFDVALGLGIWGFLADLFFSFFPKSFFEEGRCQIVHGSMVIGENDRRPGTQILIQILRPQDEAEAR